MKIIKGDILKMPNGLICHQVNCKGVMGGGLALQIKKKYPLVYQDYLRFCNENLYDVLGQTQIIEIGREHYIANIFGQYDYGMEYRQTNYDMLRQSLGRAALFAVNENVTYVYIPHGLGSVLAGGDWNVVTDIVLDIEEEYGIEFIAVKLLKTKY